MGCLSRRASSRPAGERVAAGAPAEIQPGEPIPAVASVYRSFSAGGLNEPQPVRGEPRANLGARRVNPTASPPVATWCEGRPRRALRVKDRLDRTAATDWK